MQGMTNLGRIQSVGSTKQCWKRRTSREDLSGYKGASRPTGFLSLFCSLTAVHAVQYDISSMRVIHVLPLKTKSSVDCLQLEFLKGTHQIRWGTPRRNVEQC